MRDHIHVRGDGRGPRQVYLNGKPIMQVVFADTRKGVVRFHDRPAKVHKHGKRFIERTRHGLVEVRPLGEVTES